MLKANQTACFMSQGNYNNALPSDILFLALLTNVTEGASKQAIKGVCILLISDVNKPASGEYSQMDTKAAIWDSIVLKTMTSAISENPDGNDMLSHEHWLYVSKCCVLKCTAF